MPLGDELGKKTVDDLNSGLSQNLRELEAILHGLLDRLDGAELKIVDGGFRLSLPPWTPKPVT